MPTERLPSAVVLSGTGDVLLPSAPTVLLLVGRHTHTTHIQIHRHTVCSRVYIHICSGTQSSSVRRDCGVWEWPWSAS